MYRLMVSDDCGATYLVIQEASSVEALRTNAEKCAKEGLRWCIEDDTEEIQDISSAQKKLIVSIVLMNMP